MSEDVLRISDDLARDFVLLIYNIDEQPYPGARFLRLAAVLVSKNGIAKGAGDLETLMQASVKNQAETPSSSDLEKILQTLEPNLDSGFLEVVSTQENKLGTLARLGALIETIINLLNSFHEMASVNGPKTITVQKFPAFVVALVEQCFGIPPIVKRGEEILKGGNSQITIIMSDRKEDLITEL